MYCDVLSEVEASEVEASGAEVAQIWIAPGENLSVARSYLMNTGKFLACVFAAKQAKSHAKNCIFCVAIRGYPYLTWLG